MNFKKTLFTAAALSALTVSTSFAALSDDDFIEAAWMTTRFYGAQRSGQGPNWILDGTNHPTSFTKDSYNGKDVSGGWFDCGDHVMFGQTQGFAFYVLALSYAEFTKGFYDLYTGDYTDYKASKDYTRKGGKPNDKRDLLEELEYEADFWVKAAIDDNNFVTVKGNGDQDHNKWVTAGMMSTLGTGDGGEPRQITGNANDAFIPGLVAAGLAVMSRVDPDESNRTKYLAAAKRAFGYAKKHSGISGAGSYYNKDWWNGIWEDGPFLGALELYRATKEESYKTDAQKYFDKIDFDKNSFSRFGYPDVSPLSFVMGEYVFNWNPPGNGAGSAVFLDKMYLEITDNNGIFNKETFAPNDAKFHTRSPSGGAFLYGLYAKFSKDYSYDKDIEKNIAFLLGDNNNKKSYVVGFTRNGANAPKNPHHRGYYGNEDPGRDVNGAPQPPEKNKLLGGMIAGNFSSGSHSGSTADWQTNEVCVDINAPLVGALGYILSRRAPVEKVASDVEDPEEAKKREEEEKKKKEEEEKKKQEEAISTISLAKHGFNLVRNATSFTINSESAEPFTVQLFSTNGKLLQESSSENQSVTVNAKQKGLFILKITSKGVSKIAKISNL